MTAYRWRMFLQVNNWVGFWLIILFILLASAIFFWRVPQEMLDNGSLWWFADLNSSFINLMPAGTPKVYDIHYWYAPTSTAFVLKMTLAQIHTDPYMTAMGDKLFSKLQLAAGASGVVSFTLFILVTGWLARIGRRESEDEYLSGMQLTHNPAEVNRALRQNRECSDLRVGDLHLVQRAEVMNFLIHGTIGVGKSTLIRWLFTFIRKRGDRAIIYDSGCTFTETHYNPATDFILNAHDERCANWQFWGECVDAVDYDNMAASLIPVEGESDPFWVSSSRTIFADLAIRMSADPDRSIEKFLMTLLSLSMKSLREYLANTPSANLVEEKIEKTAISIRSVVTNYAKALRYLQGLDDGVKPPFTIRDWMTKPEHDSSWLFVSTTARHRKSVRPLISLWISLTTLMLQSMGEDPDRRVWFFFDELPSLQRIPEFNETLAEGRKFGGCFVLGVQNMAQLVHVYGRELAKSIFDLLNTRMYGRSPSAEMAKLVEDELGHQRKREAREQNSYGLDQVRDGVSIGKDKVNNPIVDYEQIMRLPNLNFYVRLPGEYPVVRLKLKFREQKKNHAGLIERNIRDVLSPELEKVIEQNERAASAAGVLFPTGNEVLEGDKTPKVSASVPVTKPTEVPMATSPELNGNSPSGLPDEKTPPAPAQPSGVEGLHSANNTVRPSVNTPAPKQTRPPEKAPAAVQAVSASSGALGLLQRRLKSTANGVDDTDDDNSAGETMNLDMRVAVRDDGGLTVSSANAPAVKTESERQMTTTQRMAQEEENILRHHEPDSPVFTDYPEHYFDGEPER